MPNFAANLIMMFNEWPFLDRFDAAADAGFTAVEFLFPYDHPPEAIASVPSRNEPAGEELNDLFLIEELDRLGYTGFVGCEYRPRGKTVEGLGWFAPYASHARSHLPAESRS